MQTLKELGRGALAIAGTTLGLLVISVFFQVAIEESEAWWQWVIGLALAGGLTAGALAAIYLLLGVTVERSAAGWLGMLAGRVPDGYGRRSDLARGVGSIALFVVTAWLGVLVHRRGVAEGQLNWSIEGLFLAGAGAVFGLAAAVPAFFFGWRARTGGGRRAGAGRERARRSEGDAGRGPGARREEGGVALLLTMSLLGVGLSMAAANLIASRATRDGDAILPRAEWVRGCVEARGRDCPRTATLHLVPGRARRVRIELLSSCEVALATRAGAAVRPASATPPRRGERRTLVLDVEPGERYRLDVRPPASGGCSYAARYVPVPRSAGVGGAR